jgi:hypothetical protein
MFSEGIGPRDITHRGDDAGAGPHKTTDTAAEFTRKAIGAA